MTKDEMVILGEIVQELLAKADEFAKKSKGPQKMSDIEQGQFLQTLSTISMFQSYLMPYGLQNFGLDFDPDDRFRKTA